MKIAISRLYDITTILATKSGQQLKEFIECLNIVQDNFIRMASNNITIDENLKTTRKTITIRDNVTEYDIIGLSSGAPALVVLNSTDGPLSNPVTFNWQYDGRKSKVRVYLKPLTVLGVNKVMNVELIVFYK